MKKNLFLAAAVALFALTSCQKEDGPVKNRVNPVFTANILVSKTTIDADSGKVSWELNDEVSITDGTNTAVYEASSISGSSATLTYKSGDTLGDGPYTASYGAAPSASQIYSASVPSLPMSATAETAADSFDFTVTCGLLELSVTKPGESIKSIEVSDGSNTFTLTCSPAASIATERQFYIALPSGSYTTFTFTNANDNSCELTVKEGKTVSITANTIQPISFSSKLNFGPSFPDGTLSGLFSVSAEKQVRFSKGNLRYQASSGKWSFADHQYDAIKDNSGNTTATGRRIQSDWIDLFGWGATGWAENEFLCHPCDTSNTDGKYKTQASVAADEKITVNNGGDWGVNMGSGWRLLTSSEWSYVKSRENLAKVCTVKISETETAYGLVLLPDDCAYTLNNKVTNLDFATWTSLEAAGAVLLPAAGARILTTVNYLNCGYYWASDAANNTDANSLFIKDDHSSKTNTTRRHFGASVRLVYDK